MYPTMYPRLLITPVFAHKDDFMWIESIVCKYDSDIDDIEEPEFEFMRSTVHSESNDALKAENDKLRELAKDMWRLLLVTGNDDLVLSIEVNGVVKETIDAEELAKAMRKLEIETNE